MKPHPYRYSADPMLNSGLVPGRDVQQEKATSEQEGDASYRIVVNRPIPPYADGSNTAPVVDDKRRDKRVVP